MSAFLLQPENVDGEFAVLGGDEAHHVYVRRYKVGDEIDAIDGNGCGYQMRIVAMERGQVRGQILARRREWGESPVQLSLAPALIKGQRFDFVIEKATEVGVRRIAPLLTERGVVRQGKGNKEVRWQRLIEAAAKQCGRCRLPTLDAPMSLDASIAALQIETDVLLMAAPEDADIDLHAFMQAKTPGRVGLLIGPEGGFSPAERTLAREAAVHSFCWGERTLRADTASIALAALVLYEAERAFIGQ
jgi:16S rRNA (uracil1498-N3)-methyltransferase